MRNLRYIAALGLVVALAGYFAYSGQNSAGEGAGTPMVAVNVPALSGDAALGEAAFNARCAACHGENAGGIEGAGPPLVHKIYEPGHHGDMAFTLAARRGVQSHHWRFGNMPPVEGITDAEIVSIIAFVRALQRENGIF